MAMLLLALTVACVPAAPQSVVPVKAGSNIPPVDNASADDAARGMDAGVDERNWPQAIPPVPMPGERPSIPDNLLYDVFDASGELLASRVNLREPVVIAGDEWRLFEIRALAFGTIDGAIRNPTGDIRRVHCRPSRD